MAGGPESKCPSISHLVIDAASPSRVLELLNVEAGREVVIGADDDNGLGRWVTVRSAQVLKQRRQHCTHSSTYSPIEKIGGHLLVTIQCLMDPGLTLGVKRIQGRVGKRNHRDTIRFNPVLGGSLRHVL